MNGAYQPIRVASRERIAVDFEDLTPEQMEKARACASADELIELAKAEGIELSDELLDSVAGGDSWSLPEGCSDDYCGMFD